MLVKLMKTLELHYPVIQFLIMYNIIHITWWYTRTLCCSNIWSSIIHLHFGCFLRGSFRSLLHAHHSPMHILAVFLSNINHMLSLRFLQEFPGFMYLRQMWFEDRLAEYVKSKGLVLQRDYISQLWLPDLYCYNAKKSDLMLPDTEVHSVVRIDSNGSVLYSRRSVGFIPLVCKITITIINRLIGNFWSQRNETSTIAHALWPRSHFDSSKRTTSYPINVLIAQLLEKFMSPLKYPASDF